MRNERETVGRSDPRYTGVDSDAAGESPTSMLRTRRSAAPSSAVSSYLAHDLNYDTNLTYRLSARDEDGFKWDWKHKAPGSDNPQNNPNTAMDLAAAMRTNPYLKVLSLNGWYDMATPFFGTEFDLSHMMLEPAQQKNLEFRYYPAGHMVYLNPDALHAMRLDVERLSMMQSVSVWPDQAALKNAAVPQNVA
jgi:carboxypeptidase C (cathepsin A)